MKRLPVWIRALLSTALGLMIALVFVPDSKGQSTTTTYNINLAIADESVDAQGRTVITMMATGDLPGVLTIALVTAPDGTISGGEWALNVSYTAPLNPDAPPDPSLPDPDSAVGEQLIQRGVLKGAVTAGSATLLNGSIDGLVGVQFAVDAGTLEFASVPNGNGTLNGTSVSSRDNSIGSLVLNF